MVDEEVENILREIRERVRAQESTVSAGANSAMGNGSESFSVSNEGPRAASAEALARIDSYLATTARAWDRLPPLVSNRAGSAARMELWLKRQLKRSTRWFAWEQINFNAAVHHAIRDTRQVLSDYEQKLESLRAEFKQAQSAMQSDHAQALENLRGEMNVQIEAQRAAQRAALRASQSASEQELEKLRAQLKVQLETQSAAQVEAQNAAQVVAQTRESEIDSRFSALIREMREGFERIQDEQRVCFKQLSLEATEAAVLEDRARRKVEKLIEELKGRMERLEKKS